MLHNDKLNVGVIMNTGRAVAMRISQLLIENNMTQYRLSKAVAMPESTLRSIINEKCKTVNIDTITLICQGFGITLSQFFDSPLFSMENLEV